MNQNLPRLGGLAALMLLVAVLCGQWLPTTAPAPAITGSPSQEASPPATWTASPTSWPTATPPTAAASETPAPTPTFLPLAANMLSNENFEWWDYVVDADQRVPNYWQPWWNTETNGCYNAKPHYELEAHASHVHEGAWSARVWSGHAVADAGLRQTVDVRPGQRYRFSMWVFLWSTTTPVVDTLSDADMMAQVGIDPNGGIDGTSPAVIWSEQTWQRDRFVQLQVEALAAASQITVFTRARANWCVARSDAFWDAGILVPVGPEPPTPTPEAGGSPAPTTSIIEVTALGGDSGVGGPTYLGAARFVIATNVRNCHDLGEFPDGWPAGFSPFNCPVVDTFQPGNLAGVWRWAAVGSDLWAWSDGLGWLTWAACYRGQPRVEFWWGIWPADLFEGLTPPAPSDPCRLVGIP